jgi:agmatine/peptidylarginine deiminase
MTRFIIFFSIIVSINSVLAQGLPKGFAPREKEPFFLESIGVTENPYQNRAFAPNLYTEPPSFEKRTMAEWEEIQALTITWSTDYTIEEELILAQIVEGSIDQSQVIIICENQDEVENYLISQNISTTNVTYLEAEYNSIWMRDYGQNTVYRNNVDSPFLVDWIYNRNRPNDDLVPEAIASNLNLDIYATSQSPWDMMATGGNFMSDGMGTGFSSNLIIDENSGGNAWDGRTYPNHSQDEINNILSEFMGIDRYILMETLPFDGIHHIDMHMKLLDEETLLVAEYPEDIADGPQIEANLQYILENYNSAFGTPYKVIRIPSPPSIQGNYPDNNGYYRTYTNSVFVNNTILVPFYRTEYDTIAQRIYEQALPGYNIVGIDVDDQNTFLISYSGAIHCITHSVGVQEPLLIQHQSLQNTLPQNQYQVNAFIQHTSGIESASLYWKTNLEDDYQSITMTNTNDDNWSTQITQDIPAATTVYYYITAQANSGKQMSRPMPAPEGYFDFYIMDPTVSSINSFDDIETHIDAYPNPASAITCIPIKTETSEYATLEMYDVFGKKTTTIHDGMINAGSSKYFINAKDYAPGVYFIILNKQGKILRKKIVIN